MAALVVLAAALFGASAAQNYLAYRNASDKLLDDSLRESAGLLMQLARHEVAEHGQMLGIELLKAEAQPGPYGFRFQIWTPDMQAGYLSAGGMSMPFVSFDTEGFADAEVDGESWRAFSLWNPQRTLQVQVAQRHQLRAAEHRGALWRMATSAVALLAVATVLIWWTIGATLRPLRATAAAVGRRSDQDLSPVDATAAPREARPLLDALNRLLARIQATLAAERRFTADAAHELRTPLAAIRANAQVLLGARDPAERERTASDLLASVDRGTRLVDQLLALARADQSGEAARFRAVDLALVAAEQEDAHRALAGRHGVTLAGRFESAPLQGDAGLLGVLVRNLLDNAIRYSPPGTAVTMTTGSIGQEVALSVEDQGPGIAPDERQKVFERFHRVSGTRATGSGLGLSIARRIVELHGGHIRIEDGAGARGTRVQVTLPQASAIVEHAARELPE